VVTLIVFSTMISTVLWLLFLRVLPRKRSSQESFALWLLMTSHVVLLVWATGRQHLLLSLAKRLLPFRLEKAHNREFSWHLTNLEIRWCKCSTSLQK
jgi:hypothetical protein